MEHQPRTSHMARPGTHPSTMHDREPAPVDPSVAGTLLGGRYRVEHCIGAGAMGVVWSAWDRRLRRTVAVKQLAPARAVTDPDDPAAQRVARARAMREGRIAARVVHPRAIAVFDVVVHDGTPWLIMEYLPSRSLATVLTEQGPLAPAEVARVGAQIADALTAVHDAGIVHGDVKPGNVLLTDDGVAKLTDFGVSRASWDTTSTGGGTVAGTPGYFAPEVARGGDPTPASDVFSLGATLYTAVENELVCGRMDNTLAVLHAMAEGRLRPATRAGAMSRPLAAMLRLDPAQRPGTATLRRMLEVRGRAPIGPEAPVPEPTLPGDASVPGPVPGTAAAAGAPGPRRYRASGAVGAVPGPEDTRPGGRPDAPGDDVPAVPLPRAAVPGLSGLPPLHSPRIGPTAAAPPAASTPPATLSAPAGRRRRRLLVIGAVSAVVLAGGVGAAVAAVGNARADRLAEPPRPAVSVPAAPAPSAPGTTAPRRTPSAAPPLSPSSSPAPSTTTPAPTSATGPGAPIDADDVASTVSDYYGALPGGVDRAWSMLSDEARDASGGYGTYQRFWRGIASVSASDVRVQGTSATASLDFRRVDGQTSREAYRFEVGRAADGHLEILSAEQGASRM